MSVIGSISIKDNASAVLRGIRSEQSAFRRDIEKTKSALKETWDKKYQAKLDATAAASAMKNLKSRIEPLRKKVVTAVALKDMAADKVKNVTNRLRMLGKTVAEPVIRVKNAAGKAISDIGGKLKSLAKAVVIPIAVAGGAALTATVAGAVSEGAKLEQSIGGVETLFKGSADIVKKNAASAFETAGLSANEYMENVTGFSASLISSVAGDTAKAAKVADMAMTDMADNANKFGTDMGSIQTAYQGFAKQNYTMLDNLKLGYGGTKEEMQRLLTDAQKLTGQKYDISNLSDVYNAIHAVQEHLGVTGTTAKEAGKTFSGSFAAMKASVKNLLGNLAAGGDVEGAMESVVKTASTFLFKNAVPMVGRVLKSLPKALKNGLKSAAPELKANGAALLKNIRSGILSAIPSSMSGVAVKIFGSIGSIGDGFRSMLPDLKTFGSSVMESVGEAASAFLPVLLSAISGVQTMLPAILPVISTVIGSVSGIFSAAAPVISGLIGMISIAVTNLAPVFSTVFSGISEKVSSVLSFIGEHMGTLQGIFERAAPVIADILSTAWNVISPIMDLCISVFKLIYSTVERVFPGIQSIIESVWGAVKPLVEGVGKAIGNVADMINSAANAVSGGGKGTGGAPGKNAEGDNNWRGGLTWVGEQGAELVDLPRGSRILPHKESVAVSSGKSVVENRTKNVTETTVVSGGTEDLQPVLSFLARIDNGLTLLAERITGQNETKRKETSGEKETNKRGFLGSITVEIRKIADSVTIRSDEDIDELANRVAKKVMEVAVNMG